MKCNYVNFRQSVKMTKTVIIFLCPLLLFTQKKNFIHGILLDAGTKEPVVFATIKLKNEGLGIISNLDGSFKIPRAFYGQGRFLEISSMGYETKNIETTSLKIDSANTIFLNVGIRQLKEVVLTSQGKERLSARKIINRALKRIPENYPRDSFSLIGYYRDYQLHKDEYLNFNEAIVQIIDKGFQSDHFKETEYSLLSYVVNNEFKVDSFAAKPYDYSNKDKFVPNVVLSSRNKANELVNLCIHDAIRNYNTEAYSFIGVLAKDFIGAHRFTLLPNTSYGDEIVYKIDIKKKIYFYSVEGAIYIDRDDYSIRKLEYSLYGMRPKTSQHGFDEIYDKGKNELLFEVVVEYLEENDKMFLNYISLHNKFILLRPPKFKIERITLHEEEGLVEVGLNAPAVN